MKLLGLSHIIEADKITTSAQNISYLELMERAGTRVFELIHGRLQGATLKIHIFCGLGNNGGDGLVIARHLVEHGYDVTTYIVNFSSNRSPEFLANYDRLKEVDNEWPIQLKSDENFPVITPQDMVIDAIFGLGLNRPIAPWVKELIRHINKSQAFCISIDVPSGLYAEKAPEDKEAVIFANSCLTFQALKLVFFLPETANYVQDLELVDIGLDATYMQQVETGMELIGKQEVLSMYQPRQKFSHKGTYGHALLIGGSVGKIGSMVLASKAGLRTGAGLMTSLIPECGYTIMQTAIPEAMVLVDNEDDYITSFKIEIEPTVVCVGMGLGKHPKTKKAFKEFIETYKGALVIDADGLNILSEEKSLLNKLPKQTILTPHPKELERLIGNWDSDFEKLEKAKKFSKDYDCILVIKGANTITLYHNEMYINSTGNPGMATAGAGDVLSGIITGLISQGYLPLQAAIFGVYLHGSAGDIGVVDKGYQALLASDIIEHVGKAYLELFKREEVAE